jgi:hypothetical protein
MKLRRLLNSILRSTGYVIYRSRHRIYDHDGLLTDHNHDFIRDPSFYTAYQRGVEAAHADYQIHWRAHIALWAGWTASKSEGDFVECGVNFGFFSSAIMKFLDWDTLGKTFYLMDTFCGIDESLLLDNERMGGTVETNRRHLHRGFYTSDVADVRRNFREWENVRIIEGSVPETLTQVDCDRVTFLHLDMNCAAPEVAALEFFWPRMISGGIVLLDDYGFGEHVAQKTEIDRCAERIGVMIASLPTGQGLIIKPATMN